MDGHPTAVTTFFCDTYTVGDGQVGVYWPKSIKTISKSLALWYVDMGQLFSFMAVLAFCR